MQLDGYLGALGQLPSYDQLRANALSINGEQQRQLLQRQEGVRQQAEFDTEQAEHQQFLGDLQTLGDKPTPEQFWRLAARHPTLKGVSEAAQNLTEAQRRQTVGSALQIHTALKNGRTDLAKAIVQRSIDADKNAGGQPDPDDVALLGMIESGDPAQVKAAIGSTYAIAAAANPDTAAKNIVDSEEGEKDFTLSAGGRRYKADGTLVASAPFAPQYRSVGEGETLVEVGGEGGDPVSGGGGVPGGSGGPVDRLINSDAGGGYVPAGVKTLGQFVGFGKSLNRRGAKSSSAGTYQINGSTMAEFGPRALGADWRNAPFDAGSQEKVGEAIFNWAKQQPNPAAALAGRWVSLDRATASRLVQGDWSQARGVIAQRETGGGAGASAARPSAASGGARVVAQGAPKRGYAILSPSEAQTQGLDPTVRYQRSPDGAITAVGGQNRADSRKAGTDLRKEFDGRKEVQDFRSARPAFATLRRLATKPDPSGADDVALIFAYSKALDPTSVVRESEFKQAANTSGAVEAVGQRFERAKNGQWLNPGLRQNLLRAAYASYAAKRESYNGVARQYNGYAEQLGVDPKMLSADIATPNIEKPAGIKRVRSIQEARALPPGTIFLDPRGIRRRR